MIDPIGTPASILALVNFALAASVALHQALKDIHNYPSEVIELIAELEDLQKVLDFLRKAVSQNADDLLGLEPHLSRCGQACKDFLKLITKCSAETKGKQAVFIAWVKFKVAKSDVMKMRNLLSRVKSTTSLALGGISLSRFAVTAAAIDEYQRIVTKVTAETQQNLREINSRLDTFSKQQPHASRQDIKEWEDLQFSKRRCESDLQAFSRVLALLQKVELDKLDTILKFPATDQVVRTTLQMPAKERLTVTDIREFMEKIPQAIFNLKSHLSSIEKKMRPFSTFDWEMRQKLWEDKQADEHCLNLLKQFKDKADQKRLNVFKDVQAAERAHQVIISTTAELFSCEKVRAGAEAKQWLGQMSEESFQALCRGENTKPSADVKLSEKEVLHNRQWVTWFFVATFLYCGFITWTANRGATGLTQLS